MLLEAKQLTPTQFADAIGVARPVVSHILSGRNKPSLEVVQKIIGAFPDIALPWLLSGTGNMAAEPVRSASMPLEPDLAKAPAKRSSIKTPKAARETQQGLSFGDNTTQQNTGAPEAFMSTVDTLARPALNTDSLQPRAAVPIDTAPTILNQGSSRHEGVSAGSVSAPAPNLALPPAPPLLAQVADKEKAIRRIVIFYRDGTFTDYQPEH
ncbi:helix-turn-helix domain-containing protein [Hymenobacter sediminicola]|uniref:Helix-turn-helix transcriptional regulator n=1 Tax=Hymenobacter sediminicola TaxID=2761579 RepID=A0A7G7WBT9_9BACT|nr:helix-turn-helix transcriptional regulator [Hymenobacter sediminicola]